MGPAHSGRAWSGDCSVVFDHAAVPTLVVTGADHTVHFANRSAQRLLADFGGDVVGMRLPDLGVADDKRGVSAVLERCRAREGAFEYVRFRFTPGTGPSVSTEMVITGCGSLEGLGPAMVVQVRNISLGNSLNSFINLVAESPDGDTLMNALRWGPLSSMPIASLSLYSAHHEERVIMLRGAFGFNPRFRERNAASPMSDIIPGGYVAIHSETLWDSLVNLAERFPLASHEMRRAPFFDRGEAVCLPVSHRGTVIGGLFIVLTESVPQTASRIDQLTTIRQLVALWLRLQAPAEPSPASRRPVTRYELSEREATILRLLENGRTNDQISREIGYAESTVRADLSRLYRKLGANGRRNVVLRAKEMGLYEV